MGVKQINITLEGISPLLMHAFPLVQVEALEKKSPTEQAELAAYRDPDTNGLYIPGINVQRALVSAAAYSKGKGRASLQKQAAACLSISPERLSLNGAGYTVDSRPVVVPATKGRVMRHRPRFEHWTIEFALDYDDALIKESELRRIVDDMGSRVGLLDFRPERKGPFGRCMVTRWERG